MSRPTAVLAEDEPVLRDELTSQLASLWPELQIMASTDSGIDALHAIETTHPDVVFLDIQMPGLNGIDVAKSVQGRCHIVFVTAYDHHAIEAFEHGALDYVMKPLSSARLITTVARLKERLTRPPVQIDAILSKLADRTGGPNAWLRWVNASQGQDIRLITVDEICYFKADNKYTLVVTRESESLIRKSIRDLLERLDPAIFWQIHRSTIVNVGAIAAVHRCENGTCEVRLKSRPETLSVSIPFVHLFRQM